jgi:hypothetical protein
MADNTKCAFLSAPSHSLLTFQLNERYKKKWYDDTPLMNILASYFWVTYHE